MKAEALILRSHGENIDDKIEAMKLINQIRTRSNLEEEYTATVEGVSALDEAAMLELVLYERVVELVGEGKAWYDSSVSDVVMEISTRHSSLSIMS